MLIGEAVIELWEVTGERTDLDPFTVGATGRDITDLDVTSAGYDVLTRYLERGFKRILTYKRRETRQRVAEMKKTVLWTPTVSTFTDVQTGSSLVQFNTALTAAQAAEYVGNKYYLTGENDGVTTTDLVDKFFTIVGYTWNSGAAYGVDFATDVDLSALTTQTYAELRTAENMFSLPTDCIYVLKMVRHSDGTELAFQTEQQTEYYFSDPTVNTPASFYVFGQSVVFDTVLTANTRFWLEYIYIPTFDTTYNVDLPLQEFFDEAMLAWASSLVYRRAAEPDMAEESRSNFENLMNTTQRRFEFKDDRRDSGTASIKFE